VNNLLIRASKIEQPARKTEFFRVVLFRSPVIHSIKRAWNTHGGAEEQVFCQLFTPIRRRRILKNYFFILNTCEQPCAERAPQAVIALFSCSGTC
jgi:hypothetical protein